MYSQSTFRMLQFDTNPQKSKFKKINPLQKNYWISNYMKSTLIWSTITSTGHWIKRKCLSNVLPKYPAKRPACPAKCPAKCPAFFLAGNFSMTCRTMASLVVCMDPQNHCDMWWPAWTHKIPVAFCGLYGPTKSLVACLAVILCLLNTLSYINILIKHYINLVMHYKFEILWGG